MEEPGTDAGGELTGPARPGPFRDGPADDLDDAALPDEAAPIDGIEPDVGTPSIETPLSQPDAPSPNQPHDDDRDNNEDEVPGDVSAVVQVAGKDRAGGADDASPSGEAERVHVRVRRARPPGSVFGETPIVGPRRPPDPEANDLEDQTLPDLAAWVRHAAWVAGLRAGAQACVAGVFMGVVLGFFLSGLMPGVALLLGLALGLGAVPVGIVAGYTTYRQTLESERARSGLCPRCGYDLRGLNTARCPECGAKLGPQRQWQIQSDGAEEGDDPD